MISDQEMSQNHAETGFDHNQLQVVFTDQESQKLKKPWFNALLIQMVGQQRSILNIGKHLKGLWKLSNDLEVTDLDKGFYFIRTKIEEDYLSIQTGGPRFLFRYFLAIQQWKPRIKHSQGVIDRMAIWVQFPELRVEYFDLFALYKIGKLIGKPIKVDCYTMQAKKGKFASICIEIATDKPFTKIKCCGWFRTRGWV